jgi:PIN domain nuclease of toxin-antitoxin system
LRLLLDTSTFLWFITADSRLPDRTAEDIRSPDNDVWLSVISVWEVLVKHQLGRLDLPEAPYPYVSKQRERHRIETLPLEEGATVHLPKLPPIHRDLFDRMLICQAIEHDLLFVTSDEMIRSYPIKIHWQ